MFLSTFVLLLLFLLCTLSSSLVTATVHFRVDLCGGTTCGFNDPSRCHQEQFTTQRCYVDQRTGRATRFACIKNHSWSCFTGAGFLDPSCITEYSRNSLRCSPSSCTGSSGFSCNLYLGTVQQLGNCAIPTSGGPNGISPACSACNSSLVVPTGSCMKDPSAQGEFWYRIQPLAPCNGVTLVSRHYVGARCDDSSANNYYEEATSSGFCVASGQNQVSRRLVCEGEDNDFEEFAEGGESAQNPQLALPEWVSKSFETMNRGIGAEIP